jgi:hypothetical protein
MWWDKRPLSTYYRGVRVIAGVMVFGTAYGIVLLLLTHGPNIDPVIKWSILAILVLMLFLSVLMFRSPSRDP